MQARECSSEEHAAASNVLCELHLLQHAQEGQKKKKEQKELSHSAAAVKIQSRVRGRQVRARDHAGGAGGGTCKDMNVGKVEAECDYDDRHAAAAVKIQSSFRGAQARTRLRAADVAGMQHAGMQAAGMQHAGMQAASMQHARQELPHASQEHSLAIAKVEYEYGGRHGEAAVKIQSTLVYSHLN
jgi:hypothetical protein